MPPDRCSHNPGVLAGTPLLKLHLLHMTQCGHQMVVVIQISESMYNWGLVRFRLQKSSCVRYQFSLQYRWAVVSPLAFDLGEQHPCQRTPGCGTPFPGSLQYDTASVSMCSGTISASRLLPSPPTATHRCGINIIYYAPKQPRQSCSVFRLPY